MRCATYNQNRKKIDHLNTKYVVVQFRTNCGKKVMCQLRNYKYKKLQNYAITMKTYCTTSILCNRLIKCRNGQLSIPCTYLNGQDNFLNGKFYYRIWNISQLWLSSLGNVKYIQTWKITHWRVGLNNENQNCIFFLQTLGLGV